MSNNNHNRGQSLGCPQGKEITMSAIKLSGNFIEVPIDDIEEPIEDDTYNGWKNKETWLVNVWLNNDYEMYQYYLGRVTDAWNNNGNVMEELKEIVWEIYVNLAHNDQHIENGLINDLIQTSLNNVDWSRLAEHYIEEIKETQGKE